MKKSVCLKGVSVVLLSVAAATSVSAELPSAAGQNVYASADANTGERSRDYASAERSEAAKGHYSRARSLLIEALREFEAGRQIARPDLIVNPDSWRATVAGKVDDLSRIISPAPRESVGGARFRESTGLLRQNFSEKPKRQAVQQPVVKIEKKEPVRKVQPLVEAKKADSELARARMQQSELESIKEEPVEPIQVPSLNEGAADVPAAKELAPRLPQEPEPKVKSKKDEKMERDLRSLLTVPAQEQPVVDDEPEAKDPELAKAANAEFEKAMVDEEIRNKLQKIEQDIDKENEAGSNR